ncbi:MAG: 50S ribosome-binding GTPase [Gammaproteobacteria bacterium]|nr:50S ribosome-binding GTPase [Gammaproteobacteria bacterium]MCH9744833.1 50S ribosome-binding GTPase [Gammaproteobacteria bacterium]
MPAFVRAAKALRPMFRPGGIDVRRVRKVLQRLPFDLVRTRELFVDEVRCAATGNTLLHHAAQEGHLPLAQSLLDFDAPVDVKNNAQQTPDGLAQSMAEQARADPGHMHCFQEVSALLSSRGRWQTEGSPTGLSMNRMMQLLVDARDNQRPVIQPAVCLYGVTQAGKSTFFNWVLGTDYKPDHKGFVRRSGGEEEKVYVGDNTESATLYPAIWQVKNRSFELVDMPGFEEGRGGEMAVCVSASRRLLTTHLKDGVQALVLMVKYEELCVATNNAAFSLFKSGATPLGRMVERGAVDNVLLLASKPPDDASVDEVITGLTQLKKTWSRIHSLLLIRNIWRGRPNCI